MSEALNTPEPSAFVELAPGSYHTASDYSSGVCHVLTLIRSPEKAVVEVYESTTDNFNPPPIGANDLWHDPRDYIASIAPGEEYERTICDRDGNLTRLVVRGQFAADR